MLIKRVLKHEINLNLRIRMEQILVHSVLFKLNKVEGFEGKAKSIAPNNKANRIILV